MVAYFVSPPKASYVNGNEASDTAMSKPAFDPQRREVWYTDAASGFWVLHLDNRAWPEAVAAPHRRARSHRRRRRTHRARR
jgi:hypothetical protein